MKVAIIYYSTYGHVLTMAESVKQGVDALGKATRADIFQVPETLSDEVLAKLQAPPRSDYPVATLETLTTYDAFLIGYPTRFGTLPAQLSQFLDQTGGLWASGALYGKPVGLFTSVGTSGGGQEDTLRNFVSYIGHHGLVYIPLGYGKAFPLLATMDEVHAGSPYGASTLAGGDGSRQPSELEKKIAFVQGELFADSAVKFVSAKQEAVAASEKKTPETTETANTADSATPAGEKRAAQLSKQQPEAASSCKCVIS